jgi:16S rRNA (adenine1518-N6/adenine1519-N6)-dimethyltransferase
MPNLHKPDLNLSTPSEVNSLLKERDVRLHKSLGQHFLVDKNILNKIVDTADVKKGENILEIGAGVGTLSFALAERGANITAVEKDKKLVSILKELSTPYSNIKVINADILKLDFESLLFGADVWKVVSNPPYNITAPLLFKLISFRKRFSLIILMLQKEFSERLTAKPGSKNYSFLTVKTQYYMDIDVVHKVSKNVFFPHPKIDSALLKLKPRKAPKVKVSDEELFLKIADSMFRMRRKTLKNSLKPLNLPASFPKKSPVDLNRRGETLSLEEIASLTDFITKIKMTI